MKYERLRPMCILLLSILLPGCGDSFSEVEGEIRLDGKLVKAGAIQFSPVDGKTPTAGGPIDKGIYSVRVPVGLMKVSISAPKIIGTKKLYDTPDSPEMPVTDEALPARYNQQSTLQLEVKPGKNKKNYDLESN